MWWQYIQSAMLCYCHACPVCIYVNWQGNEYELPEDEHNSVETCRSVIIHKLIVIVLLIGFLQTNKKCTVQCIKTQSVSSIIMGHLQDCCNLH